MLLSCALYLGVLCYQLRVIKREADNAVDDKGVISVSGVVYYLPYIMPVCKGLAVQVIYRVGVGAGGLVAHDLLPVGRFIGVYLKLAVRVVVAVDDDDSLVSACGALLLGVVDDALGCKCVL